uniref:Uncharacterized protein n=1 Tax=Avena sativa TaxID=4498 RepID=A0ACD5US65_AVESA
MAPTAAPLRSLQPGQVFKPSGHQIIAQYLAPRALRGDTTTVPGLVADNVDVFSATNPAALPFHPSSRRDNGEVWGYFYGDYPTDDVRPVPGGCWVRYGAEKGYVHGHGGAMEAVAFRRRFAFHVTWRADDGGVVVVRTPWLMKEYRLNKGAAAFRAAAARVGRKANMDCVVRKIFAKPPPPPPPCSSEVEEFPASGYPGGEEAGYSSDEDLKRVGCRFVEEPARKRGPFCVV